MSADQSYDELAQLVGDRLRGGRRRGYIDADLIQIVPARAWPDRPGRVI